MKAVKLHAPRQASVVEQPAPVAGSGEVSLDQAPAIFDQIAAGLDYTKIVFRNDPAAGYP